MSRSTGDQSDAVKQAMSNFRRKMKAFDAKLAKSMKQIADDGVAEVRQGRLSKADRRFLKVLRIEGW